jgi:hypothetical protein
LIEMLPSVWSGNAVPPTFNRNTVPLRMAITFLL